MSSRHHDTTAPAAWSHAAVPTLVPPQRDISELPPVEPCSVTALATSHEVFLTVSGEVDIATIKPLRDALTQATKGPGKLVLVDLSNATFIGADGLNALADAHVRCLRHGGRLRVRSSNPHLLRLLDLTGLTHVMAKN